MTNVKEDPKEDMDEYGVDSTAFEALEKEFQELLDSMDKDENLEKFKQEYEKLYRAFQTSFKNEKRLVKRCKELNETIIANAARVRAAITMTQEDSQLVTSLKKEVDKAWSMVDVAKNKEEEMKKKVTELRAELGHLQSIVSQGAGLPVNQETTISGLMKDKEKLTKDNELLNEDLKKEKQKNEQFRIDIDKYKAQVDTEKAQYQILSEEKKANEDTLKLRESTISGKDKLIKEYVSKQEEIKTNILKLEADKKALEIERTRLTESLNVAKKDLDNRNVIISSNLEKLEKANKENEKSKNEISNLNMAISNVKETNMQRDQTIEEQAKEINSINLRYNKLDKEFKHTMNELEKARKEKIVDAQSLAHLEREVDIFKKESILAKSMLDSIIKEKGTLVSKVGKAGDKNKEQEKDIQDKINDQKRLEEEINNLKKENAEKEGQIKKLEREVDKQGQLASQNNAKFHNCLEEIKLKNNFISELQKKLLEAESKLKQQQNLYEAVRSDRNLYSKNLIEAQDEVKEYERKFKIAQHEINQLKDELEGKEGALDKEHNLVAQAEVEKKYLKNKNMSQTNEIESKNKHIDSLEKQMESLKFVIRQSEKERKELQSNYEKVVTERDIFGTQLIRRNDELALLYEKIKILQSTLSKGEMQYQQRIQDIANYRIEIGRLKHSKEIVEKQSASMPALKKEIYHLQQELLKERLQVKALSEELENPMNVHRWRKLEATDPDTFEMIQKVQTLQKRLIKKTEECVEKDVIIQQKEKMVNDLKLIVSRQPDPDVAQKTLLYQQNLKDKTKQMKAMAAELNMYQAQVNEYKYEIERITRELQDIKTKYFEQKRREQMQKEAARSLDQQPKAKQSNVARFTGGGFNLAV